MHQLLLAVSLGVGLGLFATAGARAEDQGRVEKVAHVRPNLVVLAVNWVSLIPPRGSVNPPSFLSTLYPGQRFALGVLAEGPDRDKILEGTTLSIHFSSGGKGPPRAGELKPVAIRKIRAEGVDFVLSLLKAGGSSDSERVKLEEASSLVALAVFQPDWPIPATEQISAVEISADVAGVSLKVAMDPLRIPIRATEDWLKESPPSQEEFGSYLNCFHEGLPPGQMINLLRGVASTPVLKAPSAEGFFSSAFKSNPDQRDAAIRMYSRLDTGTQSAVLRMFRLAGLDLKRLFPALPTKTIATFQKIEPLPDPRDLPHFKDRVTPALVGGVANIMDQCWAGWMATGDRSYLRALVGLLEDEPDFAAFTQWKEVQGGLKGLNAAVARGLTYQIAGWSIGAFQRVDPLVGNWLAFWQTDPEIPPKIREEIATLPTNPAFRRN